MIMKTLLVANMLIQRIYLKTLKKHFNEPLIKFKEKTHL
jgi:hypothetical protein